MSSQLDAIKARAELVAGKPDNREPTEKEWDALTDGAIHDVPALLAAVEAVLELHEEVGNEGKPGCDCGCGGYEPWCKCGDYTYPCPTVVAIRTALGEGEK